MRITAAFKCPTGVSQCLARRVVWEPRPNFFIEYPLLDLRVTPWICWKYKVAGFEYWSPVAWGPNASRKGERWPATPWICNTFGRYNGDGHLLYPGADLKPWSSIRFEALRDGLEDYEYLWTLDELLKLVRKAGHKGAALEQAARLLSLEGVVKANGSYAQQATHYLSCRREIACSIAGLKGLLNPKSADRGIPD